MYIIRVDDLSLSRLILHGSRSRVTVQHPPSPPHPMCRVSVPPSSGRRLEKDWTNFIAAKAAPSLPPSPHSSAARSAARPDLGPCVAQRYRNGGKTPLSSQRGKNTRCRGEPFTIRKGRGERTINAKRCCCRKLLIRPRPLYAV